MVQRGPGEWDFDRGLDTQDIDLPGESVEPSLPGERVNDIDLPGERVDELSI